MIFNIYRMSSYNTKCVTVNLKTPNTTSIFLSCHKYKDWKSIEINLKQPKEQEKHFHCKKICELFVSLWVVDQKLYKGHETVSPGSWKVLSVSLDSLYTSVSRLKHKCINKMWIKCTRKVSGCMFWYERFLRLVPYHLQYRILTTHAGLHIKKFESLKRREPITGSVTNTFSSLKILRFSADVLH